MHSKRGLLRMLSPTQTASSFADASALMAISIRSFGCVPFVTTARLDKVRPKVVILCDMPRNIGRGQPPIQPQSTTADEPGIISFSAYAWYSVLNFREPAVEKLIQRYVDHLRNERNVSPHTLRNYLSDLLQFSQFLVVNRKLCLDEGRTVDVRKVDIHIVRTYLAALTKNRKKSSMGRKLAALKGFFRYLVATRQVEKDPLRLIHSPKQEKPLPNFLSVDDVFQLLGAIKPNSSLDFRDRAVLEVFYSTGIRASELVGLNWSDVDFQLEIIRVVGKGSKERIVPIGEVSSPAVRDNG